MKLIWYWVIDFFACLCAYFSTYGIMAHLGHLEYLGLIQMTAIAVTAFTLLAHSILYAGYKKTCT